MRSEGWVSGQANPRAAAKTPLQSRRLYAGGLESIVSRTRKTVGVKPTARKTANVALSYYQLALRLLWNVFDKPRLIALALPVEHAFGGRAPMNLPVLSIRPYQFPLWTSASEFLNGSTWSNCGSITHLPSRSIKPNPSPDDAAASPSEKGLTSENGNSATTAPRGRSRSSPCAISCRAA